MPDVRVRSRINIAASLDADETQGNFSRPNSALSEVTETFETEESGEPELSAAEVDYALPKGKITTIKFIYIETTGDITIKLDGEATGHKIGTPATGTKAKLLIRTEMTAAPLITNNSATAVAPVSYFMAGDK